MVSSEQTELNRDRLTHREQDDSYWEWGGQGGEGLSKKEKGLMDIDNSVVTAQRRDVQGLNCNGKIQEKNKK